MADDSEARWHLGRFPRLLGGLLVAPVRTLAEIDAAERGGVSVALIWSLLAAVALRFTSLCDAVLRMPVGGGMRIVGELTGELTMALPVVLAAAVLIVVAAGDKREPGRDLELGAAAVVPFLVLRALFRAAVIVADHEAPPLAVLLSYVAGAVWALGLVLVAVRLARRRPTQRPGEAPVPSRRRALAAGVAAMGALGAALAVGGVWTARNFARLGPIGRGTPAADFRLPRIDGGGGTLALSDLRGQVVVLDFWASWCGPCLAMLPRLHQLHAELAGKGVTFLGVNAEGSPNAREDVVAFLGQHGAPYPVVFDDGTAQSAYRVNVLPTLVIVRRDGTVDRVMVGATSKRELGDAIAAAAAR